MAEYHNAERMTAGVSTMPWHNAAVSYCHPVRYYFRYPNSVVSDSLVPVLWTAFWKSCCKWKWI